MPGGYIDDNNERACLGLFGYLGEGGRIENVGVEDSYVKGTGESACVGGVCGKNSDDGEITDCFYLAGTAKEGVGEDDSTPGSVSVTADPKTAEELADAMNKMKDWKPSGDGETEVSNPWIGNSTYQVNETVAILFLPTFKDCEQPTVTLVAVNVAEAIDFETETVEDGTYKVQQTYRLEPKL